MPDTMLTDPRMREIGDWLIRLDPQFKALLEEEAAVSKSGSPPAAGASSAARAAPPPGAAAADATPGSEGRAKLGTEVDVIALKLVEHPTQYGAIKVTGTLKASTTAAGEGEVSKTYTANDAEKRESGVKKAFSLAEMEKAGMLGFEVTGIKIELETEFSGPEVAVGATLSFNMETRLFKAPAKSSTKIVLLKYSGESGFSLPSIELSIVQAPSTIVTGSVATTLSAELKGSYVADKEKILKEIGKDVVKKIAKDALEKEAKRLGVKILGREAGELVLKNLGPVAAAFSVGLDIGGLLNDYTVAPKVAAAVDETILGDLNERYQAADTLGKMWLLSKNSPKIVAALVASGVAGAVAGMGDLVLFKIMGLPAAKDFKEALEAFGKGLTELAHIPKRIVEAGAGAMVYGALVLGIKCNPKHAICAHGSLEPVIAAIFAKLHPLYKPGGYEKVIMVQVKDAKFDEAGFQKFAKFAHGFKMQYGGKIDLTSETTVANSLRQMLVAEFLGFLEANKMIRCNVVLGDDMDADKLDPKLLDELYG